MRRSLWLVVTLVVVTGWLVLAYLPALTLPQLALPASLSAPLALVAAAGLGLFLAIQGLLVNFTDAAVRRGRPDDRVAVADFNLNRGREFFWTVLPLLMTLGLALMTWGLWSSLL